MALDADHLSGDASAAAYDTAMVTPFLPDDEKIPAIREALPATSAGIYLNTGTAGPLPRETARAMAEAEGWELSTGRADANFYQDSLQRRAEARAAIAAVIGTDAAHVALTHAATDGMNIAAWAVDWKAGDRVVTTNLEHAGGMGPLWAVRERFGVELVIADIGLGVDGAATLAALDRAIVPGTRLVSVSHVTWATGAVLPIGEIVELAHSRGALVAVDGAQAVMGAVYCADSVLDGPRVSFAGYWSFESIDLAGHGKLWPDARRFEGAILHGPSVLGLARSAAWLSMFVGLPWIHERTALLAGATAEMLAEIPGVEVLTPRASMAGLVTFRLSGWKSSAALRELAQRTLCIARTIPPLDAVRISVGFFNTGSELRRFRDGVALVAGHTPETIPHRARIEILRGGVE